ncbi:MAG: YcgN family cysteine cluster protein [Mariprofundales bacterium]
MRVDLAALDDGEWESLCDGCGRCCLCKFEDEDSGEMLYTDIVCAQFDLSSCRCRSYGSRSLVVADCLDIRQFGDAQFRWLPATCAYRLAHEGKQLPAWHPWLSGDAASVHRAGIALCNNTVAGNNHGMSEDAIIAHIVPV